MSNEKKIEIIISIIAIIISIVSAIVAYYSMKKANLDSLNAQESADKSLSIEASLLDHTIRENQKYTNLTISAILVVLEKGKTDITILKDRIQIYYTDSTINCFTENKIDNRFLYTLKIDILKINSIFSSLDNNIDITSFSDIEDNRVMNCKHAAIEFIAFKTLHTELLLNLINSISKCGEVNQDSGAFVLTDDKLIDTTKARLEEIILRIDSFSDTIKKKTGITNKIIDKN